MIYKVNGEGPRNKESFITGTVRLTKPGTKGHARAYFMFYNGTYQEPTEYVRVGVGTVGGSFFEWKYHTHQVKFGPTVLNTEMLLELFAGANAMRWFGRVYPQGTHFWNNAYLPKAKFKNAFAGIEMTEDFDGDISFPQRPDFYPGVIH